MQRDVDGHIVQEHVEGGSDVVATTAALDRRAPGRFDELEDGGPAVGPHHVAEQSTHEADVGRQREILGLDVGGGGCRNDESIVLPAAPARFRTDALVPPELEPVDVRKGAQRFNVLDLWRGRRRYRLSVAQNCR
jgi:hypothetical protein